MQILQPPGWARAKGFSNGIAQLVFSIASPLVVRPSLTVGL